MNTPPIPAAVGDERLPALVAFARTVIEATKYEGQSNPRNRAEEVALRKLLTALGYPKVSLKVLSEFLLDEIG